MSKNLKFKNEEFVPGALFLMTSFSRDRKELEAVFSEFTAKYETDFATQTEAVKKMESSVVMNYQQQEATKMLYAKADAMNKELNVLSFWLKKAKLQTSQLTKIKRNLLKRNIEGACNQLEDVIQLVKEHESKLVPFGMKVGYYKVLDAKNAELRTLGVKQTELMNKTEGLTSLNAGEYKKLHAFIQNICKAGKILYDGTYKEDEYTIQQLIRRMRSANSGTK